MYRNLLPTSLCLPFLAACAVAPSVAPVVVQGVDEDPQPQRSASSILDDFDKNVVSVMPLNEGGDTEEASSSGVVEASFATGNFWGRQSAEDLAMWNDPKFRKRFMESYIAETEIEPPVTIVERDEIQKILEYMSEDKVDKARRLLEKNRVPGATAAFDFTLAHIELQLDNPDAAAEAYAAAVEKYPNFRRAWEYLGLIRVRQGEFKQGIEALTRVIGLGGASGTTYGALGYAYSSLQQYLPAETAYRRANMFEPDNLDWKMGMAESLFKQGRFADVVALSDMLIEENPASASFWMLQANAYLGLEKPEKAAENLAFVEVLGQANASSMNLLGDIYVNQELYDAAVDSYVRAIEMEPDKGPDRAIGAAKALAARSANEQTARLVDSVEASFSSNLGEDQQKDLLRLRARVALARGEGDEEARVLEEIVKLDPLDGDALILLGDYYERLGDLTQAEFYYERAAGIEEFEARAKVRHARMLVGQSKYNEALPMLRRAQTIKYSERVQEYLEAIERLAKKR